MQKNHIFSNFRGGHTPGAPPPGSAAAILHVPFIQPDNTVIFKENSKAIELEETFFKGKHLNINQFD